MANTNVLNLSAIKCAEQLPSIVELAKCIQYRPEFDDKMPDFELEVCSSKRRKVILAVYEKTTRVSQEDMERIQKLTSHLPNNIYWSYISGRVYILKTPELIKLVTDKE